MMTFHLFQHVDWKAIYVHIAESGQINLEWAKDYKKEVAFDIKVLNFIRYAYQVLLTRYIESSFQKQHSGIIPP